MKKEVDSEDEIPSSTIALDENAREKVASFIASFSPDKGKKPQQTTEGKEELRRRIIEQDWYHNFFNNLISVKYVTTKTKKLQKL